MKAWVQAGKLAVDAMPQRLCRYDSPMRVLVLGGTLFIGPPVVRKLCVQGHAVTVFHRGQTEADLPSAVGHLHGDRQQLRDFAPDFRKLRPDVVLDMRPITEEDARGVIQIFRGIARRVVAISSQDVYRAYGRFHRLEAGPPDPFPLTEDAPLRQRLYPHRGETPRAPDDPRRWLDDYEKILVERAVLAEPELPGTVLRLPMVYGPGDPGHRLYKYLRRMDDRRPAILLDEGAAHWRGPRGYVENVAAAIALALAEDRAAGRVYNVAEPDAFSEAEWVKEVGRVVGWNGEVVVAPPEWLPAGLAWPFDPTHHWPVDSTRIRTELGYAEPLPREEALRRTVAWERRHPPEEAQLAMHGPFDYAAEDAALAALHGMPADAERT